VNDDELRALQETFDAAAGELDKLIEAKPPSPQTHGTADGAATALAVTVDWAARFYQAAVKRDTAHSRLMIALEEHLREEARVLGKKAESRAKNAAIYARKANHRAHEANMRDRRGGLLTIAITLATIVSAVSAVKSCQSPAPIISVQCPSCPPPSKCPRLEPVTCAPEPLSTVPTFPPNYVERDDAGEP
jgi:hypothetical protein